MKLNGALCAVIGHRWRVDDATTFDEAEPIHCIRCGRRRPLGGTQTPERILNATLVGKAVDPESETPHPSDEQQDL